MKVTRHTLVNVPVESQTDDCVAFQLCEFSFNVYGRDMTSILDTRIDKHGRQYVIEGDGFIKTGLLVN